ncbi:hypothetical protein Rhsp01_16440 [Rhizobium sp. NBRC 114257]|uniref:Uncharacterized protein n=1 Tax=Rhizobium dioscoreae TaxID=2653122 RepID=A0ABQ0Z0L6_9HYPH|nr:hypothetical protein RsS93_16390 [Rhizobium dioscoreae]GLU80468.1 hypothetical protein Rhsp01_16440 [Rhizobium sp. NBRC 114257]
MRFICRKRELLRDGFDAACKKSDFDTFVEPAANEWFGAGRYGRDDGSEQNGENGDLGAD